MKARHVQLPIHAVVAVPVIREAPSDFPAEMLEQKLGISEIAKLFQWGYHKTYEFWKHDPRTLVSYRPDPARAAKKHYQVPKSAVLEQFQKMCSHNRKKAA
jgi:hypothetical protein